MNAAVVGGQAAEKGTGKGVGPGANRELNLKLLFSKNLQHVANRIHATQNVDEIILEVAASRLTERGATRADDRISESSMEDRKREGYF